MLKFVYKTKEDTYLNLDNLFINYNNTLSYSSLKKISVNEIEAVNITTNNIKNAITDNIRNCIDVTHVPTNQGISFNVKLNMSSKFLNEAFKKQIREEYKSVVFESEAFRDENTRLKHKLNLLSFDYKELKEQFNSNLVEQDLKIKKLKKQNTFIFTVQSLIIISLFYFLFF